MTPSPTFKRLLKSAANQEKLIPVIQTYLQEGLYPDFDVKIRRKGNRAPDGWFHPSTHPLWPERQLYWYLHSPQHLIHEPLDPLGTMATTAGTFWHSFMSVCLIDAGVIKASDVKVSDRETKSRGEMDGVMDDEAFEFKTMNAVKLNKLVRGAPRSPEVQLAWRDMVPTYYAQAQEYMRLSGFRVMRFLVLDTAYPFPMREIAIDYDAEMAGQIREKYLRVRQAVADQRMPEACCNVGSKTAEGCFARLVCPNGRAS